MVQVDDAGSGSLVGGTCIAILRVDTGEYKYEFIPVSLYQNGNFYRKYYLEKCKDIVINLLKDLQVSKEEKIEICQGYMFDAVRKYLEEKGYNWRSTRILDPLQSIIEQTFNEYALELGVPIQYVKYTKYPLHFHRILRWVYADYQKRCKMCKTDWKSFKKYGYLNLSISYDHLYKKNYTCLRCGKKIIPGSKVKVLNYISNRPNTIYLHTNCN
ncbi:MAG: hypothetical protein GX054_02640 [Clostridiales bacterium]|nr:hypothetical protein [Clostridiales bacterium]